MNSNGEWWLFILVFLVDGAHFIFEAHPLESCRQEPHIPSKHRAHTHTHTFSLSLSLSISLSLKYVTVPRKPLGRHALSAASHPRRAAVAVVVELNAVLDELVQTLDVFNVLRVLVEDLQNIRARARIRS